MNPDQIVSLLTPVIVPLVLAGVKKVLPSLPSWIIPVLSPFFGVGLEWLHTLATTYHGNFLAAAALGLAGVGLREIKEGIAPAPNGGWGTPS